MDDELHQLIPPSLIRQHEDVGTRSFPPSGDLAIVFPPDTRQPVADTTVFPAGAIAQLVVTDQDGSERGATGTFISARTILTAGHAVFAIGMGYAKRIIVSPGRNGDNLPFGWADANAAYAPPEWRNQASDDDDWGLVVIPHPLTPQRVDFVAASDADLVNQTITISGYPVDKAVGTQWFDTQTIQSVFPRGLQYFNDTFVGQSGAGILRQLGGTRKIVGIHTFGDQTTNGGIRITAAVAQAIAAKVVS